MREIYTDERERVAEKQARWDKERSEIEKMTDGLGLSIDGGIKEAVIAHRVHGFETYQSCEGHDDEREEAATPYIDVGKRPSDDFWDRYQGVGYKHDKLSEEDRRELATLTHANFSRYERMLVLLEAFYKDRNVPMDQRLSPGHPGFYGQFRLEPYGGSVQPIRDVQKRRLHLHEYQKEMAAFTDFLKREYFSSGQ